MNISTATRTAAEITEVQFLVKSEPLRKVFALRSLGSTNRIGLAKRALTGHWDLSRVSGFCVITAWLCSTALPADYGHEQRSDTSAPTCGYCVVLPRAPSPRLVNRARTSRGGFEAKAHKWLKDAPRLLKGRVQQDFTRLLK